MMEYEASEGVMVRGMCSQHHSRSIRYPFKKRKKTLFFLLHVKDTLKNVVISKQRRKLSSDTKGKL